MNVKYIIEKWGSERGKAKESEREREKERKGERRNKFYDSYMCALSNIEIKYKNANRVDGTQRLKVKISRRALVTIELTYWNGRERMCRIINHQERVSPASHRVENSGFTLRIFVTRKINCVEKSDGWDERR